MSSLGKLPKFFTGPTNRVVSCASRSPSSLSSMCCSISEVPISSSIWSCCTRRESRIAPSESISELTWVCIWTMRPSKHFRCSMTILNRCLISPSTFDLISISRTSGSSCTLFPWALLFCITARILRWNFSESFVIRSLNWNSAQHRSISSFVYCSFSFRNSATGTVETSASFALDDSESGSSPFDSSIDLCCIALSTCTRCCRITSCAAFNSSFKFTMTFMMLVGSCCGSVCFVSSSPLIVRERLLLLPPTER
mmetsp:Transcript_18352/g.42323  ORF Transcript_18352/g.42323 Transcript_18352/m.42323 type:complete len:254 (-) Transcript_18352:2382-3143(-)